MPKALRSAREDTLYSIEATQLLKTCLDTLNNLVFGLHVFSGLQMGEVQHAKKKWIDWYMDITELPTAQMYESRIKEARMNSLNKHPP